MDSILSVRISDELKQRFMDIAQEQGINNKDLMEQIIKSFELDNAKEISKNVKNDIEELQSITSRIVDIYLNIIEKNKVKNTEITNILNEEISKEKEKTNKLNDDVESLKNELKAFTKENMELKNQIKVIKETLKETEDNLKESKQLNLMLKEKNDILNIEMSNYKEYENKNILLEREIKSILRENQTLNDSIKELQSDNKLLSKELEYSKEQFEEKLVSLEANHRMALNQQEERLKIGFSKEILQIEQMQNNNIIEIRREYEEKISNLMKEREEESYKIRKFLLDKENITNI